MSIDVIDLRDFYSKRLGIVARQLINRGVRTRWPSADGQRVLGIGYPTPYLGLFREDAERCIAFMPAAQGVLKWPTARPTLASLIDEYDLPLPDSAVDRVLLVHALGDGLGTRRRRAVAAGGRRPHRGSHQAGVSRDPGETRAHTTDPGPATGACAKGRVSKTR